MSEPPRAIGRYDVEHLLGQGGMGRVWLARDTVLGRSVAIKVLRDDLALPPRVRDELIERMRHEARAAAAVSHPNIVTLHDMGEDPVVGLFLVFEYVPGPSSAEPVTLRDRLRDGGLPLGEVSVLARELGGALSFAHEAGVIHRDIKPENILFSRTGAKIADFGIARIPESTITRANTVLGTPAYTAPEALSNGTFGPRSDQFSLAATIYEAATGVRAFGNDDPITTAGKVSNALPPPLEATLGGGVAIRALGTALLRGVAKDPQDRFGSCAELGDAVTRALERGIVLDGDTLSLGGDDLEIERTPLSSRVSLGIRTSERSSNTPIRPSVFVRQRTHRMQNIMAAIALLVIILLIVLGRKSHDDNATSPDSSKSAAAMAPKAPAVKRAAPALAPTPTMPPAVPRDDAPVSSSQASD